MLPFLAISYSTHSVLKGSRPLVFSSLTVLQFLNVCLPLHFYSSIALLISLKFYARSFSLSLYQTAQYFHHFKLRKVLKEVVALIERDQVEFGWRHHRKARQNIIYLNNTLSYVKLIERISRCIPDFVGVWGACSRAYLRGSVERIRFQ